MNTASMNTLKNFKTVRVNHLEIEVSGKIEGIHHLFSIINGQVKRKLVTSSGVDFLTYPAGEWQVLDDDTIVDIMCNDEGPVGAWLRTNHEEIILESCRGCVLIDLCKPDHVNKSAVMKDGVNNE